MSVEVASTKDPNYFPHTGSGTVPHCSQCLARHAGDTIQAFQFHDDALGRVLEDLADHGSKCLATLGMRMQTVHDTLPSIATRLRIR